MPQPYGIKFYRSFQALSEWCNDRRVTDTEGGRDEDAVEMSRNMGHTAAHNSQGLQFFLRCLKSFHSHVILTSPWRLRWPVAVPGSRILESRPLQHSCLPLRGHNPTGDHETGDDVGIDLSLKQSGHLMDEAVSRLSGPWSWAWAVGIMATTSWVWGMDVFPC